MINLDDFKTELKRKQLWDIVEGTDEPASIAWCKKNAMALDEIKCYVYNSGFDMDEFYDIISAKIAWDILAAICDLDKSKLHRYLYISL